MMACSYRSGYPPELTKTGWKRDEKNHQCAYTGKFTAAERQTKYPYNVAAKVWLVSFDTLEDDNFTHILPMQNNEVNLSALSEKIPLSQSGIDSLSNILFNMGYLGKILTTSSTGCYDPQNAVLFADETGKIIEYMELCFKCSGNRMSSDRLEFGEPCYGKYEALRGFFRNSGIKIGTTIED